MAAADPAEHISVTVVVRQRAAAGDAGAGRAPSARGHLRREEFAAR